ncbi:MAG TPA: hypothetical protein VE136_11740 [Anaerolineales bacterium]|jgi:hypothetical protein|nr:hypothetical protein [Anaerolineales bacterium]
MKSSTKWGWILALIGLPGALFLLGSTMLRSFVSELVSTLSFLALAIFGVAYTLWPQQKLVAGAATAGTLQISWGEPCTCSEPGTVCRIDPSNPEIIDLAIERGYPRYTSMCSVALKNLGGIPVKITDLTVVPSGITAVAKKTQRDGAIRAGFKDDLPSVVMPNEQQASDREISIGDDVQQNTTYQFSVQVNVQQYP